MRYILALLLAFSLLPGVAKADLLPDNMHGITNCVTVSNIADYPDYDFVWKIDGYRGIPASEKITSSDAVCDVGGSYTLLAIKKTDWSKVVYKTGTADESGDPADQWVQDSRNANLFIASNYTVGFERFASDTTDIKKTYTTVHIDFASDTGVTAHTSGTLSTDGSDEPVGEAETDGNLLTTSAKVLIAIGLFGLGYMIAAWKKK